MISQTTLISNMTQPTVIDQWTTTISYPHEQTIPTRSA